MDPQGASTDDLDVRLDWPGEEPEGAAETEALRTDGSALQISSASLQQAVEAGANSASPRALEELELETLRATIALMSARLEALAGVLEGARFSYGTVGAAIDQLEHSITGIARSTAESNERTSRTLAEITDRVEQLAAAHDAMSRQLEALRRRMPLRGRAEQWSSEEMIELIASAVAERLSAGSGTDDQRISASRRRRRGS